MTTALIVDDSTVDRELVSTLLQASTSLQLVFADDGAQAIAKLQSATPDIIVTDMHMPQVDGLRLVEAVRQDFAHVPIVLITGQGSESLAVQALKAGAASYVPKASLSSDLVPTVMHVLSVARADQNVKAVQSCWQETQCSFVIPNDHNMIPALVRQLRDLVRQMHLFDETQLVQLSLALEEAISNALYHGNLELSSHDLQGLGYDLAEPEAPNVVEIRMNQSPYRDRQIHVQAKLQRERIAFTVRDEGPGFQHQTVPTPEEVLATGTVSGRGLAQMQLFCDQLEFNATGNEVTLTKHTQMAG